jgi:probable phosphoglycerate mutase
VTRFVLIRHGQSQAQVDEIVSGHDACRGLSELGRRQASALRDRLRQSGELRDASVLYTSLMARAIETAAIIAPALELGNGSDPRPRCGLCEQHPGVAEGLRWVEYQERYGGFNPLADRSLAACAGQESIDVFVDRVGGTLRDLATEHEGETVVIACHGGVVACAFEALSGLAWGTVHGLVDNTAITEWRRDGRDRWWLARFNDAAHLATLE